MAVGDRRGNSAGKKDVKAFEKMIEVETELREQAANVVVGEFLSELQSAIRFRMKMGQTEGDWIEEPERYFTDGAVFATEEAVASQVKLQLTVSLDASTSMWGNRIMQYAGPTFAALDSIVRASMRDLPEGTVYYAPFVFHGMAFKVPQTFIPEYAAANFEKDIDSIMVAGLPHKDLWEKAVAAGEIPATEERMWWGEGPYVIRRRNPTTGKDTIIRTTKFQWLSNYWLSGADTNFAPLIKAIKNWEETEGDPDAVRLDIVLTDGVFDQPDDVALASKLQEDRNGKLKTVLLNFLPPSEWGKYSLPDRCSMYAVTVANLDNAIRTILTESINELF